MVNKVNIKDGVLKRYLVGDRKTKSWTVPKDVKKICSGAFDPSLVSCGNNFEDECDLENWETCCLIEKVKIGAQVEEIEPGAFAGLDNLEAFEVDEACPCVCEVDGILYSKDMSRLICIPGARKGTIQIANGVKTICKNSCEVYINSIIMLPDSVVEIEGNGFNACYADEIWIPESVTKFGRNAFGDLDKWDFVGVVIGKENSAAEKYAKKHDIEFESDYDHHMNKSQKLMVDQKSPEGTEAPDCPAKAKVLKKIIAGTTNEIKEELKVGDVVTFGLYPQTGDGEEQTPIEWQVLGLKSGKVLLISKYGLDAKPYLTEVAWETCALRKWLNNDFLNTAFSAEEQAMIQKTTVTAEMNPDYDTNPGKDTTDMVFLLSVQEANQYLASDKARRCAPTAYARAQGAFTSEKYKTADGAAACQWWLRSLGTNPKEPVNYVGVDGKICSDDCIAYFALISVRPALWVSMG